MDRMRAELPPCGRTTACAPSSSGVLPARGRFGTGGTFGRQKLLGGFGCRGNATQRRFRLTKSGLIFDNPLKLKVFG